MVSDCVQLQEPPKPSILAKRLATVASGTPNTEVVAKKLKLTPATNKAEVADKPKQAAQFSKMFGLLAGGNTDGAGVPPPGVASTATTAPTEDSKRKVRLRFKPRGTICRGGRKGI